MKTQSVPKGDAAVSPVVGVLLMLVVTIIIAAVVSGFAGGLTGSNKAAPSASLDVQIDSSGTTTLMTFKHMSGDAIPTKDLDIITYYTNSTGYVYKHTQTPSSNKTTVVTGYYAGEDIRVPYLNDMKLGYAQSNGGLSDFGNFTFKVGNVMTTSNTRGTAALLGIGSTGDDAYKSTFNETDFKEGKTVDVKIMHKPSGKYIFDKEVTVQ